MTTTEQDVIRRQTLRRADRFDHVTGAATMKAIVTSGQGGLDRLEYRDVPVPGLEPGEVLLQVLAAGVNTTDINTRLGWYSPSVTGSTRSVAEDASTELGSGDEAAPDAGHEAAPRSDGGWSGPTPFPLTQGTDCCGRVVAVGRGGGAGIIGRRALVRPCMRPQGFASMETIWMASDFDGAFAQFVKAPASEVFAVESELSDAELGVIPCAYGTAENMLRRARVGTGQSVLVTGASGGVGSAAVQLAKRRGAVVTAVAARAKIEQVLAMGADRVVARGDDITGILGERSADVVVDNVSGPEFGELLRLLRGGSLLRVLRRHRRSDRHAR